MNYLQKLKEVKAKEGTNKTRENLAEVTTKTILTTLASETQETPETNYDKITTKPPPENIETLEDRHRALLAWAEGLLEGRPDVRVEIPGFYGDARIAFKKVSTPAELTELRQQAEVLGLSGIVWSGVEAGRDLLDRWQALESEVAA